MSGGRRTRHHGLHRGGARTVGAMACGAGWLTMARRAFSPDALCMGGAGAGAARRRGVGAQFCERARWRQMYEVETGAPVVVFAGNGFARKGLGPLLEAWPAIKSRPYLLVAGTDRSAARYVRMAHRLGVSSRVRFLGAVGQIEQLFLAADAFALPSFFEPFGNVVMEAMAGGLGVMVSAQAGAAELLPPAMHPFVVKDPNNPAEIAERLAALLETKHQSEDIVRAAAEDHPWSGYATGLLKIVDSLKS